MGARIEVKGVSASIHGPTRLRGERVRALDLRSGGALVVAGLMAEGTTEVENIFHVDRGHENIVGKLTALGARVRRMGAVRDEADMRLGQPLGM
jgi:UDP-N-acetylglucosamine 1-carboxyvinyltransferase